MENRLYVTNLSASASLSSVRQYFASCGDVLDVELVAERNAKTHSAAYVTMATAAAAEHAVRRLNGTSLDGRSLMVSVLPAKTLGRDERDEAKRKEKAAPTIAITQQYRERHNMTYELDCAGSRLTLKIFFPPDSASPEWRIEARSNGGNEVVIEKAEKTRERALTAVSEAWQALPSHPSTPSFDWPAVTRALQAVRAI